jgi:2-polyprenyl-6-methoxyphenol hydroxylase-like FAD-dependent oxidoreductase
LPQTELEPILTRRASQAGWKLRFHTSFVSIRENSDKFVVSEVHDNITNVTFTIRSRFLFGCDGARSQVLRELKLPLTKKPGQGLAINVLVKVDLSGLMEYRTGNLHWLFDPEKERPPWAWACIVRMVRPWDEWMFIFLPRPGTDPDAVGMEASTDEYLDQIKEVIGDSRLSPRVADVSKWRINEVVADKYSDGNVYVQIATGIKTVLI